MNSVARGAIALLMLLGLCAGAMQQKTHAKHNVVVAGGGPAPMCPPPDPCAPPIPPR
jgi:hypothetical protein